MEVIMHNAILHSIFLIFSGAAILATLALWTRQSLLVAYIVLGAILGPGLGLFEDKGIIRDVSDIGIVFLLFLLGLNLEPQSLVKMLKQTTGITVASSFLFGLVGAGFGMMMGFNGVDSLVIGTCMMFSSTIIGLKLLPTTVLHHQKMGEIVISILLLQDIIAIFALLLIEGAGTGGGLSLMEFGRVSIALPGLILLAFAVERWVLVPTLSKFSRIHEFLFLVAIGWCLALGQLAEYLKVSFEVGAFIAGISLAASPVARFIAESLKPLRDFFLILFFFSLGAGIDLQALPSVLLPAAGLAILMIAIKPFSFKYLLKNMTGSTGKSWEIGVRIGQISEFSLLVVYKALSVGLITQKCSYTIQIATIFTFMISSYWILNRYHTPVSMSEKLRRD